MKLNIEKPTAIKGLMLIVFCAMLSSFAYPLGGDSYSIYINNKLVLQEHVYGKKDVAKLILSQDSDQDQLSIHYSHCGVVGTSRNIVIKDNQNRILKEWHFVDAAAGTKTPMTCNLKDIIGLSHGQNNVGLYYSSNELKKEQLLASIYLESKSARKQ